MRMHSHVDGGGGFVHPQLMAPLRGRAMEHRAAERVADVFAGLADATRVRIVHALSLVEEACVVDLARVLGITQSSLSHQLALLRAQGSVARRREGRIAFYRLVDGPIRTML